MKRIHVILLVLVAVSIGLLIYASDEVSTYGTFEEARLSGVRMKITGTLEKDKPIIYDPIEDPNYFSFYLKDNRDEVSKVVMLSEKPHDFELSEQVVLTGSYKDEEFLATDMLMKCPSKYKDEEAFLREN